MTAGCYILGVEYVSKWKSVQYQYRIHWFSDTELNTALDKVEHCMVYKSQGQTHWGNPLIAP